MVGSKIDGAFCEGRAMKRTLKTRLIHCVPLSTDRFYVYAGQRLCSCVEKVGHERLGYKETVTEGLYRENKEQVYKRRIFSTEAFRDNVSFNASHQQAHPADVPLYELITQQTNGPKATS